MAFLGNTWRDVLPKETGPSSLVCPNQIAVPGLKYGSSPHDIFWLPKAGLPVIFFYEAFWCLSVNPLPLQASSLFLIPNKVARWTTRMWLAPQHSPCKPTTSQHFFFSFLHQPLANEARVTDHCLDNELFLQTHQEQGTFPGPSVLWAPHGMAPGTLFLKRAANTRWITDVQ